MKEDIKAENYYSFNLQIEDTASKAAKLLGYMKFRMFASDVLKKITTTMLFYYKQVLVFC
ncbi:hypothetical protein ACEN4N_07840 [Ruoffia sp. FAM 20857]